MKNVKSPLESIRIVGYEHRSHFLFLMAIKPLTWSLTSMTPPTPNCQGYDPQFGTNPFPPYTFL